MEDSLLQAYRHCQALAKREARNFYYGFLLLPQEQRQAMYAVYAFARQCDDIVDAALPQSEKVVRLADFRHDLANCLDGHPAGPIFTALNHTVKSFAVPHQYLYQLIEGVETDLTVGRYPTFTHLRRYCYLVASTIGLISIEVFGYRGGQRARDHAVDLGIAFQLTNILRDIQEDAQRGRVYIPQDEMASFGYQEQELLAGLANPAFLGLLANQVARARRYYQQGGKLLPLLPRRARACVGVMAGIYSRILDDIERRPAAVFRERIALSTSQKLALAGRELVRSLVQ